VRGGVPSNYNDLSLLSTGGLVVLGLSAINFFVGVGMWGGYVGPFDCATSSGSEKVFTLLLEERRAIACVFFFHLVLFPFLAVFLASSFLASSDTTNVNR